MYSRTPRSEDIAGEDQVDVPKAYLAKPGKIEGACAGRCTRVHTHVPRPETTLGTIHLFLDAAKFLVLSD